MSEENQDELRSKLPHLAGFSFNNDGTAVIISNENGCIDVPVPEFLGILDYIKIYHPHLLPNAENK